ncbi:MAG: AI-2E family transporter [Treponema sp.]|jgi:predicted PurR-regulated permease PerM|nr:AI-2E family transporter [Treponema sp.]
MSDKDRKSRHIQNIVFGAILILLFFLVCRLFAPFVSVLLWSILIYIILKPLHQKCIAPFDRTTIKGKICCNALAAVFSLSSVIIILIPLSFVIFQLFRQVTELIYQIRDYLASHSLSGNSIFEDISRIIRDLSSEQIVISADELRSRVMGYLTQGLQNLLRFSGHAARNVGSFIISLVFMVFILFFFFADGAYLSKLALRVIPIRKEYLKTLVGKFKEITQRLVLGYIIVALAEAVAASVIFSLFRVSGALVFAVLIFFFSFFPIVGPSFIWIPLGLVRIIDGNTGSGILLMIISGGIISTIENFLRPIILRDRIHLHPLIIFFAILGGISAFGINGIILGPMVMIIFLTVFDLFLTEHKLEDN